jgi:HEAT repeat protein
MLGELKDEKALRLIEQALSDSQPSVRGAAAAALGDLGLPQSASIAGRALSDPVPAVRAAAAVSLGELKARDSKAALNEALGDTNPGARAAVVSALLRVGSPYQEIAVSGTQVECHRPVAVRACGARALSAAGNPEAGEVLRLLLQDPLPRPRIAAARALGHLRGTEVIATLKSAMRDQDDAVRATAAGALFRSWREH